MDENACAVPLVERLRRCPVTNIGVQDAGPAREWTNYPVRDLMHEAADRIAALESDLADYKERLAQSESELDKVTNKLHVAVQQAANNGARASVAESELAELRGKITACGGWADLINGCGIAINSRLLKDVANEMRQDAQEEG